MRRQNTKEEAEIKIPEKGEIGLTDFKGKTEEKFRNIDGILYAVVAALVITSISALIAVGAIVIDQLHFNNQTYRDYSQQTQINQKLLEQNQLLQQEIDTLKAKK